jgi:hypothetical protein
VLRHVFLVLSYHSDCQYCEPSKSARSLHGVYSDSRRVKLLLDPSVVSTPISPSHSALVRAAAGPLELVIGIDRINCCSERF